MNGGDARNHRIVLARRPEGMVDVSCFAADEAPVPEPGADEFLVRTQYLTIDPAIRGWLNERGSGYLRGVEIGEPVRGAGLGEVVSSNAADIPVGARVMAMTGWQEYSIGTTDPNRPFEWATVIPADADPVDAATVLSNSGWTAYAAVTRLLRPEAGDEVLVTGASSLVGSVAAQLAGLEGARVVGTAGSADKCAWLVDEAGLDACINYRTEDLDRRLAELFPSGIDGVFDNVGGATLDSALRRIAVGARVVLCGAVSTDNADEPYRLANYDRLMSRRATMTGFNTIDHLDLVPEATERLGSLLADRRLRYRVQVRHGLDEAPGALVALYNDSPPGKLLVEV